MVHVATLKQAASSGEDELFQSLCRVSSQWDRQNGSAPANGADHVASHGSAQETSMDDFEVPDQVEEVSHIK